MWFDRSPWLSESEAGRACGELEDTDSGIVGRSFSFGCIRAGCTPKGTRRAESVTNWMTHRTRLLLLQFYAANDICHARCTPAGTRRAGIVTKRVTEESPPSPLFFLYFYFLNCFIPDSISSCMVYTYRIKDGRERDKLDDRGIAPFSFCFNPPRFSCMVYTCGSKEGRESDKLDETEESPTSPLFI